jgi:glycosyltransferase involved in cell wall biosynthesis
MELTVPDSPPHPRCVMLVTSYYPPHVGGVEQYVERLARQLVAVGVRVVVVTTSAPGAATPGTGAATSSAGAGITTYRLPVAFTVSNSPVPAPGAARILRRIVEREGVQLMNVHAPVAGLADLAVRARTGLPTVLTYHTGPMAKGRFPADLAIWGYERFVLPGTARRADRIIVSSDYVRREFPGRWADDAEVVTPGVDVAEFTPGPAPAGGRLLFAASLMRATAYKGLPDLLAALSRLHAAGHAVTLEVAGDGDARTEYTELAARLGIAPAVTFLGDVSGAAMVAAYQRADIFVLPSRLDNRPTVLIEAMACARPVISTRVGGVPELVEDGVDGLLVDVGDVGALAEQVLLLIRDRPLAARLGRAGRAKAERSFSWQCRAAQTLGVYGQAMGTPGTPQLRRSRRD